MSQLSAMVLREFCLVPILCVAVDDVVASALVGARKDGKSIFEGKKVTGFSNDEEEAVGRVKVSLRF